MAIEAGKRNTRPAAYLFVAPPAFLSHAAFYLSYSLSSQWSGNSVRFGEYIFSNFVTITTACSNEVPFQETILEHRPDAQLSSASLSRTEKPTAISSDVVPTFFLRRSLSLSLLHGVTLVSEKEDPPRRQSGCHGL